ncbi:trypsin-like peptidase domain-containing protein [Methylobacterium oryzae CBMB20]
MGSRDSSPGGFPGASPRQGRRVALLGALLLIAGAAQAQERPAPPRPGAKEPPVAATAADPAFEAAKAAFEALPEAERRAIQDALVWTGDFNAVVSGAFGRRTFEALAAYRARTGGADPLDPRGRAALLAAGAAARTAARFRVAADPVTGAVIGVPERLLAKRTALPAGTRWQSQDGRVTLETRAFPPGGETLDALYERATAPLPNRKVTYKLRRPDTLVVTAETEAGLSYTRYNAGPQGVRGFLIGYDRASAPEVNRLMIAVANAFDPFPAPAPPPMTEAAAPAARAPVSQPPALPAPAAGTGLAVAPGRVLTAASVLEGCAAPRIGGAPARILASDPSGLALLEAPAAPAPVRPPPRTEPVTDADGLIALAPGGEDVSAAPVSAVSEGVVGPLQPGSAGAPVLDRSGRIIGLVARYPTRPRLVAGVVPPLRVPLVPAAAVSAFLAAQRLAAQHVADAKPLRDGGPGAVAPAIVGILCR